MDASDENINSQESQSNGQQVVVGDITVVARSSWNGWFKPAIQNADEVLVSRGGSAEAFKIYDELERDAKVAEQMQKRRLALISREWIVEPASDSLADVKAADLVRRQFEGFGYDRLTSNLFDAVMKGTAFVEPIWQKDGNEIVCADFIHCEPWMFNFTSEPDDDDLIYNRFGVRLASPANMVPGDKIPQKKMIIHRTGSRYSNPWGVGLGNRLYWPVYFKRQGIDFWLSFAERFGSPVPWGQYPQNATPAQKQTLRNAMNSFAQELGIMTPQGMQISLLEHASTSTDTYKELVSFMDGQIAGIILGKSGGKDSGGQLATAIAVENEVRLELVKGDADQLDQSVNEQLVRWIVDYNCPGADYPTVRRVIVEPQDTKALAETFKTLSDVGFVPTLQTVQDTFGDGWTEKNTHGGNKSEETTAPQFSAQSSSTDNQVLWKKSPQIDGLQLMDAAARSLPADMLDAQSAALFGQLVEALKSASTYEEMLALLDNASPHINTQPLAESLQRAMFASNLFGKSDAEA